jgi:hypothetical protein
MDFKPRLAALFPSLLFLLAVPLALAQHPSRNNSAPSANVPLSSITAPTGNTNITTGTFSTNFTVGDFAKTPIISAFGITDTATSSTDNSTDFTVTVPPKSYHQALNVSVDGFTQLQVCNLGSSHVGATLFGNAVSCSSLSKAPYDKVTITDNTGSHTGLAVYNASTSESGTMVRLLSATSTAGAFNFLTACAGTTAADGLCKGTIVATLTAPGAFSVATSVTAPEFCIGSSCITSWPGAAQRANNTFNGNIVVRGAIVSASSVVTVTVPSNGGARDVALYSIQSPENWFEDLGFGQLSDGFAHIEFDSTFAQTVNANIEYHVFLTPDDDSEGLYVSNKTPQGFDVHEQRGGRSNIAFDYRVVAKRLSYESIRLGSTAQPSGR